MECISTNIMERKTSPLEDLKIRRPKKSGPFLVFLPRGIKGQKLPARLEQNALGNQKPMLQLSDILRVTFHKLTLDSEARFTCHYCLPTFEVRLRKPRLLSLGKKKKDSGERRILSMCINTCQGRIEMTDKPQWRPVKRQQAQNETQETPQNPRINCKGS